jgi:phosphatidylglycerol:prolipoprotein diacylglycerol transferase
MFPTVAGLPMYVVLQTASVLTFLLLACWYLRAEPGRGRGLDELSAARGQRGGAVHPLGLTALYVLCNFVVAKVLFDVRNNADQLDWLNYLRPQHYFDGGFWGWPAAFLPTVLLYPLLLRIDRVTLYRAVALTLPPVLVLQKTACLAIGCCVGRPTDLPWGLTFGPGSQARTQGVPVHPVPLYDIGFVLAMYGVLLWLDRRPGGRVFLFPVLLACYGLNRFATEFFREDYEGRLSLRQILALAAAVAAAALVLFLPSLWRRLAGDGRSEAA